MTDIYIKKFSELFLEYITNENKFEFNRLLDNCIRLFNDFSSKNNKESYINQSKLSRCLLLDELLIHNKSTLDKSLRQMLKNKISKNNYFDLWVNVVLLYLLYIKNINYSYYNKDKSLANKELEEAYINIKECYNTFLDILSSLNNDESILFVFESVFKNMFLCSSTLDLINSKSKDKEAYKHNLIKTNKERNLDDCVKLLMSFFSRYQSYESKEVIFKCSLIIIKICFKLKSYRNTKTFIGWIERTFENLSCFNKACQIQYNYFLSRINLYDLNILKTIDLFENMYKVMLKSCILKKDKKPSYKSLINYNSLINSSNSSICPEISKYVHSYNKKVIFEHLIVLQLFKGKIPSLKMLKFYNVEKSFIMLVNSYKTGNIKLFDISIDNLEKKLTYYGLILIVEKLKSYVFRNFIYRIYTNMEDIIKKNKHHILKLSFIFEISNKLNYFSEYNEFEFMLSSTIHKGLINAYIHNDKKELVFSNLNPFNKFNDNESLEDILLRI